MKTAVAITLIIAGVVIVAIPPLSDAWNTLMVTRLLDTARAPSTWQAASKTPTALAVGCSAPA